MCFGLAASMNRGRHAVCFGLAASQRLPLTFISRLALKLGGVGLTHTDTHHTGLVSVKAAAAAAGGGTSISHSSPSVMEHV